MRKHWRYLKYVLRHKWFVLVAGLRIGGIPLWRLLVHDWSKFTPAEWGPYARYFYGAWRSWNGGPGKDAAEKLIQRAFDRAWLHHQKANKHHWQYWLLNLDQPKLRYFLQSHDGGITGNVLVDKNTFPRTEVYLPSLDINKPGADECWQLVRRVLEDANRAGTPLAMPESYAREMVADWMGAGRAITGKWEAKKWYETNRDFIQLEPATRLLVEKLLARVA